MLGGGGGGRGMFTGLYFCLYVINFFSSHSVSFTTIFIHTFPLQTGEGLRSLIPLAVIPLCYHDMYCFVN